MQHGKITWEKGLLFLYYLGYNEQNGIVCQFYGLRAYDCINIDDSAAGLLLIQQDTLKMR